MRIKLTLKDSEHRFTQSQLKTLLQFIQKKDAEELILTGIDSVNFLTDVVQVAIRLHDTECKLSIVPDDFALNEIQKGYCKDMGIEVLSMAPDTDISIDPLGNVTGQFKGQVSEKLIVLEEV